MRSAAVSIVIFAALTVLAAGHSGAYPSHSGASPMVHTKVKPVGMTVVAAPKKIVMNAAPSKVPSPPPTKKVIVEAKPIKVAKKVAPTTLVVSGGKKGAKPAVVAAPKPAPKSPAAPTQKKSSDIAEKTTGGPGGLLGKILGHNLLRRNKGVKAGILGHNLLGRKKGVKAGLLKVITG